MSGFERKIDELQQATASIERMITGEERYLKRIQAARVLDCDPTTIDRLVRKGAIKRYDVAGMARYKYSELIRLGKSED